MEEMAGIEEGACHDAPELVFLTNGLEEVGRFKKSERGGSKSPCWGQAGRFDTPVTALLNWPTS